MKMSVSRVLSLLTLFAAVALSSSSPARAAGDEPAGEETQKPIEWQNGPMTGALGTVAEVQVPENYVFAEAKEARRLLEMMGNPTSGSELGVIMPKLGEDEE